MVLPSGRKSFRIAYRLGGQERTISVGPDPEKQLADARSEHERVRAARRKGVDPRVGSPLQRAAALPPRPKVDETRLWRNVAARYVAFQKRVGGAQTTIIMLERQIACTVALLAEKPVDQVAATDVVVVIRPIEAAGLNVNAHEVRVRCAA